MSCPSKRKCRTTAPCSSAKIKYLPRRSTPRIRTPRRVFLQVRAGPLQTLSPTPMHNNRMDHAAAMNHSALEERPQRSYNSLDLRELRHCV